MDVSILHVPSARMVAKLFPCLIGLLSLLVLFPTESDAFANGGNSGIPGKRAFEDLSDFQDADENIIMKRRLCDVAKRVGC